MSNRESPLTIGIEEEYLLVDLETLDVATEPPKELMRECQDLGGGQVTPEFLRAQIEIGTKVCNNIKEARDDLVRLRRIVVEVSRKYGLAPIAASTHPFASWHRQKRTDKDRYRDLDRDMQAAARRLLICGMHVHVGVGDDDLRIDLMNQLAYFLPHLLALTCSSPFWESDNTGLQSYRLTVFDGMPRTRLPESFRSFADYQRHIDILVDCGVIEDATKIWWDIRPSARYPTLETRVMDVCTRLDDAVTIAALLVCHIRMLDRLRRNNQRWRVYANMLVMENRWRAMRYGCDSGLIDFGKSQIVPYPMLLDEMLLMVREDAEALDCVAEIENARKIIERGNSARQQLLTYDQALSEGKSKDEALRDVARLLVKNTQLGL